MTDTSGEPSAVDESLSQLLELERRVEARVREAEQAAQRRVEQARAAGNLALAGGAAELEKAIQEEEQADLARHDAELHRIAAEGAARVRKLTVRNPERIDRLARDLVLSVMRGDEVPP